IRRHVWIRRHRKTDLASSCSCGIDLGGHQNEAHGIDPANSLEVDQGEIVKTLRLIGYPGANVGSRQLLSTLKTHEGVDATTWRGRNVGKTRAYEDAACGDCDGSFAGDSPRQQINVGNDELAVSGLVSLALTAHIPEPGESRSRSDHYGPNQSRQNPR